MNDHFQLINVSTVIPSEEPYSNTLEWAEDKEGKLRELFKVLGYPTMIVLGTDGKINEIIPGVPEKLKTHLLSNFVLAQSDRN